MKIVRSFLLPSLLALSLASAAVPANAAAGSLDPTFGKGGIAEANVGFPVAAASQPDGKILNWRPRRDCFERPGARCGNEGRERGVGIVEAPRYPANAVLSREHANQFRKRRCRVLRACGNHTDSESSLLLV